MPALMPAPLDIKVKEEPEQISTQIALFISKVWNIVNNSDTNDLISWSIVSGRGQSINNISLQLHSYSIQSSAIYSLNFTEW